MFVRTLVYRVGIKFQNRGKSGSFPAFPKKGISIADEDIIEKEVKKFQDIGVNVFEYSQINVI